LTAAWRAGSPRYDSGWRPDGGAQPLPRGARPGGN
jgi:hypothetical protein